MQDVTDGNINCVIVKDLSRLGREYIETGRYLRRVFPAYGVRFIAITDSIDTAHDSGDDLTVSVKNIMNEAYCRDISIKTRSSLDVKRRNGDFVGAFPVYGYMKAEDNKNLLVPDPYAARVVCDIFRMRLEGASASKIASELNRLGILSPLAYKKNNGLPYAKKGYADKADCKWSATTIIRILQDETYTGTLVQGKQQYPEISVYDTYIDNGATGTNFHRPGFQQMLSDIEAGHVNCVIVKDLSRLGRNTIDTGYYIEQYFRIRNIRFIAVNENFDTVNPEDAHSGIIIPLRNMINEAYALDIGRKIRAQQRQAMKDGKFIGARTPYGYLKAEDDCHQLIIDPVAAVVVQRMFRWASEGAGLNTIAVRLNEAGVLTPSHYKKMQGKITHENLLGSGKWQTRTVGVILRSEVYTGDLVQGQTKTVDHRQVKADAEEWTVVRDTHEAIISREQFAAVQEILNQTASRAKAREVKAYTPNLLKGKVFCAHCGGSLHRQRNIRKKSDDVYLYYCLSRSRTSKDACPGVTIREDALLDMLADMLQDALDTALGQYTLSLAELPRQADDRAELREKITSRKQEIQRLRGIVRSLYENLVQGVLTKDEYFDYKEKYESRIADLAVEMEQLEDGLRTMDAQAEQHRALEQDAAQIKTDRALTAALIERLIDRIEVSHDNHTHDISRCHGIWSTSTILRILADERYTGVYVIGKRAVLEVGGTRSRLKDRESWYIIPDHHPAIVEKAVFDTVQAIQLRFSQPNKKKRDYPLKGKAFCGCCGHALSRTMQKTSYYHCRHSEADEESRCHKMRLNAAELEQAVFLTLKKQMEAAVPLAPDGTLRVKASVPERAEYEQQIEALQDGKRTLYEHYLMGEIDLNTYKAEKAACDELLLKTKNAYAAVLAQAKQKQDEQARQDSRKEASKALFDADTLTTELAELLIDRVLVYPDKRIEIAYKIRDIFD